MILTGDLIPAARAAELGLVNTVVPADQLLDAGKELAGRIIRHAPTAVAACLPIGEGLAVEAACRAATVPTDGVRTGLRRFIERRPWPTEPTRSQTHRRSHPEGTRN